MMRLLNRGVLVRKHELFSAVFLSVVNILCCIIRLCVSASFSASQVLSRFQTAAFLQYSVSTKQVTPVKVNKGPACYWKWGEGNHAYTCCPLIISKSIQLDWLHYQFIHPFMIVGFSTHSAICQSYYPSFCAFTHMHRHTHTHTSRACLTLA